jgi:Dyp-type peroxidase family
MRFGKGRLDAHGESDLQAGVVRAISHPHAHYLFVRLDHGDGARRLLRALLPEVIGGGYWGNDKTGGNEKPPIVRNVALSAAGLRTVGVPHDQVDVFGDAFAQGMRARAEWIGDTGPSDPEHWVPAFAAAEAHLVIWIHARSVEDVRADAERWRLIATNLGLAVVHEQEASMHTGAREHFGFSDGAGQPLIEGARRQAGQTGTMSAIGNRSVGAGEFVLGYADSLGVIAPAARTALGQSGTMFVLRQFYQDVARFRSVTAAAATAAGLTPEVLQAKLMGRWPDGTPLMLWPDGPPPPGTPAVDGSRFDYSDDPLGARCPLGAHARRGNPRDALLSGKVTTRHRLIRRAMPYGPVLPDGVPDDGADRGLMFGCFNASIERQFEFVQRNWFNDGSRVLRGEERDPFVGAPGGSGRFLIGGYPPTMVEGLEPFVLSRGGEYYLLPGRAALAALAWS